MSYHAQIGQDIWVVERTLPARRSGFFVDVGAYDGMKYSNTLTLERDLGWSGIAIEAEPRAALALRANRQCQTVAALVDGAARTRWFAGDRGMLSYALSPGDGSAPPVPGAIRVKTRTLADILDEAAAPHNIEYLTVDIEGGEADALMGFPFDRYAFEAMTIEVHAHRAADGALLKRLRSAGYARVGRLFSDWFVRRAGVENADQSWLDEVLLRRLNPAYWIKPEVAHVPWIQAWKRERGLP